MPWSIPMIFTTYAGLDIGRNGGGVDLAYEDKFRTRSRNREERGLRLKLAATYEAEKALHSTWPT